MFRSICTALKEHPRTTLLITTTMVGCITGGIAITTIDFNLIGFGAMAGAAAGLGFWALSIYCCCPSPTEHIPINDITPLTTDNNVPDSVYIPNHPSSTHLINVVSDHTSSASKANNHILERSKLIT